MHHSKFSVNSSYSLGTLLKTPCASLATIKLHSIKYSTLLAFIAPLVCASVAHADDANRGLNVDSKATDNLFLECATLKVDAARLACFDTVAMGQKNTIGTSKKPLDLVKSLEATFTTLKPQAVLADGSSKLNPEEVDGVVVESTTTVMNSDSEEEVLAKVGVTQEDINRYTPLSLAYDLDKNSERGLWTARSHNPMYLMPLYAHFDPNRAPVTPTQDADPTTESIDPYTYSRNEYRPLELKAQISLKSKIMEDVFETNADLWFGYTQQMHWQVYNEDNSRPFRATDYMPEIFLTQPVTADLPFDGQLRMLGVGAIHHSNGQSDPLSRSWNRIYLMGGAEWGKLTVIPKVWAHIKNESDANPSDNPDIIDYYGHGELQMSYDLGKKETLNAIGRFNFDTQKGGVEVNYSHPITDNVNGFMQIFHGYGESIVDYNEETTSVGVGVTLSDWQGL